MLGFEYVKRIYNDDDFANVFNACKNPAFGKFYRLMDICSKKIIYVCIEFYT